MLLFMFGIGIVTGATATAIAINAKTPKEIDESKPEEIPTFEEFMKQF